MTDNKLADSRLGVAKPHTYLINTYLPTALDSNGIS